MIIKLAILVLQVCAAVFRYMEERRLITEGEREQIAQELTAAAQAAAVSKQIRTDVGKMSDAQIDAGLSGDFRD